MVTAWLLQQDHSLDRVKDHALVLADCLRNSVDDSSQASVEVRVVVSTAARLNEALFLADTVQNGRNDEWEELRAVFADRPHNYVNALQHCLVMVNQRLIVEDLDQRLHGDHTEFVFLGNLGLLDVVALQRVLDACAREAQVGRILVRDGTVDVEHYFDFASLQAMRLTETEETALSSLLVHACAHEVVVLPRVEHGRRVANQA